MVRLLWLFFCWTFQWNIGVSVGDVKLPCDSIYSVSCGVRENLWMTVLLFFNTFPNATEIFLLDLMAEFLLTMFAFLMLFNLNNCYATK